jgi:hypothetical protein
MMLTAWQAGSQSVISKDSVVISKDVARKVLIELADYDRLRENKVEANLGECIDLLKEKDTLISYISRQNLLYKENLELSEDQLKIKSEQLNVTKNKGQTGLLFGALGLSVGLVLGMLLAQ